MAPGASSSCRSSSVTLSSSLTASSSPAFPSSSSETRNAVSMELTTLAANSELMYRSSCLIFSIWAATKGVPRRCSGRSKVVMCRMLGYPVSLP